MQLLLQIKSYKMESIDEIEDFLKRETEKTDKEFLEKLKNIKNKQEKKESERNYKEKLKQSREKYEEKYKRYLERWKKSKKVKNKPLMKREKTERYKVKRIDLKLSQKENLNFKWDLFKFKFKIKTGDFFQKIIPSFLIIFYLKTKIKIKRIFSSVKKFIEKSFSRTKNKLLDFIKNLAEKIKKLFLFIIQVINKIKKKKTEKIEIKKEKTEEEKLIEKILSKKE